MNIFRKVYLLLYPAIKTVSTFIVTIYWIKFFGYIKKTKTLGIFVKVI